WLVDESGLNGEPTRPEICSFTLIEKRFEALLRCFGCPGLRAGFFARKFGLSGNARGGHIRRGQTVAVGPFDRRWVSEVLFWFPVIHLRPSLAATAWLSISSSNSAR